MATIVLDKLLNEPQTVSTNAHIKKLGSLKHRDNGFGICVDSKLVDVKVT